MKKHLLLLVALLATNLVFAAKIYVNPGHGSWTANDRNMATVTHALGDTTGFYESNTNMWKCYYLREKLQEHGHTVIMSHTKCGYSPELKVVATEAQQSGADHFISVHSNAGPDGSNGSFANYPSYWYRGKTGNPYSAGTLDFAKAAWPHTFDIHQQGMEYNSSWSLTNPGFYADISFWGSSSTTTIDGVTYTGYYGVIRHGIPGYIVEGYFHTYQPARHRALNPDWCRQEGLRHYRGIAAKFGTPAETKGYIMGYIRTKEKTMNKTNYQYTKGNDQYMPINGARVYLTNIAGDTIMTDCYNYVARKLSNQKCYTTDNNYNGVFVYDELTPGTYTITVRADGYKKYTETITVTADKTAYTQIFLTSGTDEEEEPTPEDPTPDPGTGTETEYASGMNPYAYGLYHEMNADSTQITLRWWLNAPATSVKIIFNDGEKDYVVRDYKNVAVDGYKDVINTSVLPRGKQLTWRVDVTGAGFKNATKVGKEYSFLRPTSVDTDDNPESAHFGRLLCNEGRHEVKGASGYEAYKSYNFGAGLYEFDAAFNYKGAYNGGNTFTVYREDVTTEKAIAPHRIRIADDGRIFVTSFNGGASWGGKLLWEVSEDLNTWTPAFGYAQVSAKSQLMTSDGYFIAAPNVGFDVQGSGDNLKMLMLSANTDCSSYVESAYRCYEYAWGKNKTWSTAPTKKWFDGNKANNCNGTYRVINHFGAQVQFDNKGGIWMCQYRANATDVNPSLVYYDKDGVYRYHELMNNRGGGGFRFNKDFTRVIISGGNGVTGEATVYRISNDANGYPTKLTKEFTIDMKLGDSMCDYAWDYADNIYAVSYSQKKLVAYALPHAADKVVSTPAASKYAFTLQQTTEPEPDPEPGLAENAEGMNPFAYALSSTLNVDSTILTVNYTLNATATEVNVVVLSGDSVLATIASEGLTKGTHAVEIPTTDFPKETPLTWRVDVKGAGFKNITFVDNSVKMFCPTSVDIDNNPKNENFGTVFCVEGRPDALENAKYTNYISYTDGAGLYLLNADGTPRQMPNQGEKVRYGYNGGRVQQYRQYFDGNSKGGYSPYRVRVSDDGRIFITSMSPDGHVLWEADPLVFSRPDAEDWQTRAMVGWTKVMSVDNENTYMATEKRNCTHTYCGINSLFTEDTDKFIAGPNLGFDVQGSGKNLKLLMLSGCKEAIATITPKHFYCSEYELGEAKQWTTEPSREIFRGHVVNYGGVQVQYDKDGKVWLCQYRQGQDASTLIQFNRDGSVAYEEDPRQPYHRCGAIRFNNDFTQVAIASIGSGTGGALTIYPVLSDGTPDWTKGQEVDTKVYTHHSLMDFAWDYANNLYIAADETSGGAGECIVVYAMPHAADKVVSTPASDKYTFTLPVPAPIEYEVKVTVNDSTKGSVEGAGVYEEGTTVTLTATANEGYEFVHWIVDGDTLTANPLELVVLSDVNVEAVFAAIPLPQYTVSVIVNDSTMGSVEGAGVYEEGMTATLVAVPNNGYVFEGWTIDENLLTENPLYIVVESNIVITATFKSSVVTGTENVGNATISVKKILRDGHVYISINDQLYTTTGARVE